MHFANRHTQGLLTFCVIMRVATHRKGGDVQWQEMKKDAHCSKGQTHDSVSMHSNCPVCTQDLFLASSMGLITCFGFGSASVITQDYNITTSAFFKEMNYLNRQGVPLVCSIQKFM